MLVEISLVPFLLLLATADPLANPIDCTAKQLEPWSYVGINGPQYWGRNYRMCNGQSQSPIVIDPRNAVTETSSSWRLTTFGYGLPLSGLLENNGHAAEVRPNDGVARGFYAGGTTYNLQQFHFHFGSKSYNGSEHIISGEQHTMELHLVHQNERNQVAVIGILFKESQKTNLELNPITKKLSNIRYYGDETEVQDITLENLFPSCKRPVYFVYDGSLTTPACTEGVQWIVMNGYTEVSTAQMRLFRRLYSTRRYEGKCPLADNVRPVQDLNGRTVSAYDGQCIFD